MKTGKCAVCSVVSTLNCSKCKLVNYCSKSHQSQDWKEHKKICFPIKLNYNSDFNRSVYSAKSDIKAGSIIFADVPIMIFPMTCRDSIKTGGYICMGCCKYNAEKTCSKCQRPVCNQQCENEPFHAQLECKVFAKIYPHQGLEEAYFRSAIVRALLLRKEYPQKWESLLRISHGNNAQLDNSPMKEKHAVLVDFVRNTCKLREFEPLMICKVVKVLEVNLKRDMHVITCAKLDSYGRDVAMGCLPNVVMHPSLSYKTGEGLEKFESNYFAMKDIKKGEPLIQKINDTIAGTFERRKFIDTYFGYLCKCKRCADPTECGTYFSAVTCECRLNLERSGSDMDSHLGYFLSIDPLNANSAWKCNNCSKIKDWTEIRNIVENCQIAIDESASTYHSELQMRFFIALQALSIAKSENREMTSDEKKRVQILSESIIFLVANLMVRRHEQETKLHPFHHILIKSRLLLLDGIFLYLQLNQKEKCVMQEVEIQEFTFSIDGFQFFDGVPDKWLLFNEELRDLSNKLLSLFQKVFPDSAYQCEKLQFYLTFVKWMIMKEKAKVHRNFPQFMADLMDWEETKKKIDCGLMKYHAVDRTDKYLACISKMESLVPKDNAGRFSFFVSILEENA